MPAKPPVVLLSGVRWNFLWQRHHTLATLFARAGYPTTFVETTGLANPRPKVGSLRKVLERASRPGIKESSEEGLSVYSPLVLPPTSEAFRRMNRELFIPKIADDLRGGMDGLPIVVAYPPTRTTLDLIRALEPRLALYDCSEEYAGFAGVPRDISLTEREMFRRADIVSCTSGYLLEKARRFRQDAFLSGPGVNYEMFEPLRGKGPAGETRVVCYFGHLGRARIRFDVLKAVVGAGFELRIVGGLGEVEPGFLGLPGVDHRGEVAHRDLPQALSGVDAFVLPYRLTRLTLGISPAKIFECLATGKPVVSSPLPEMKKLENHVHLAEKPEDYVEVLRSLDATETEEKRRARIELARENSWERRFSKIEEMIWRKLG
ncbi:MAG: glycosyltransferase family protein [Rubrobacteraceae bacterium]